MNRQQMVRIIVAALMLLSVARGGSLLLADPLIATANNYDMIRVQACVDAYPLRDASIPPWSNSYLAPIGRYHFLEGIDAPCFFTSEAIFALASLPLMVAESHASADGSFSIRWVGAIKYLALVGLSAFATWRLLSVAQWRFAIVHAAIFLLIINDPGVTIYLSTFYAEFSAILFAYLMILTILLEVARAAPKSIVWNGLLLFAPILLATAKVQHIVTPWIFLSLILVALLVRRDCMRKSAFLLLLTGALIGTALQAAHLRSDQTEVMGRANIVNTVFYGLLENASDAPKTLATLRLTPECEASIGKNWFTPGMQEKILCPEVFAVTRLDMLRAIASDPAMAWRTVMGGIPRMRPWVPSYLGLVEGQELGKLPGYFPSVSSLANLMPPRAFVHFFFLVTAFCAIFGTYSLCRGRLVLGYSVLVMGLSPLPLLAIVVFGDGYADTAKQSHLAFAMLVGSVLTVFLSLLDRLIGVTKHWTPHRARPADP